jgi:type I restriction-modification system DNA methylase subunit
MPIPPPLGLYETKYGFHNKSITPKNTRAVNQTSHDRLVSFIWSIADDYLRDVYVRGKYRDVILPMVVLRRLDTLLEPTKDAVLEEVRFQKDDMKSTELDDAPLIDASRYVFYNTSKWTLKNYSPLQPTTSRSCWPTLRTA